MAESQNRGYKSLARWRSKMCIFYVSYSILRKLSI